jgi:O-acetyl-ADP-ribose deacetylase (regulator of RNase III)
MPTTFTKGDLFNTEGIRAYAHGCNCAGTMDAGVAVAFKKRWPRMFEEYAARCADGRFHLGDVFVWNDGSVVVYNLATQEHWKKKAKLPALAKALRKSVELAAHAGVERIGLPRIGAGLGGLEWPRVKSVLGVVGGETPVTLVVFEQFVRAPVESVVP